MERKMIHQKRGSRSGQAMAELLVGLVAILLLVVGLQQASIVSQASFKAYSKARMDLAEQLADPMADFSGDYLYAVTAEPGKDKKIYTGDDEVVIGDDRFYTEGNGFLESVRYYDMVPYFDDVVEISPEYEHDPFYRLSDSFTFVLSESFSMYQGVDYQPVEVVPFLSKVIGRDTIRLKSEIWMPAWDGLRDLK